jgi:hypothetical protein
MHFLRFAGCNQELLAISGVMPGTLPGIDAVRMRGRKGCGAAGLSPAAPLLTGVNYIGEADRYCTAYP